MQLLNNEKETNCKQEKNKKSATKSQCFPPNPQTGYSCLQELGPGLFTMTLCHFSFSKSDVTSERHKENRNTVSDCRKWENLQLNRASENLQLVGEVTERSQDVCLHCEQLLNGFWQKVKSKQQFLDRILLPHHYLISSPLHSCPLTLPQPKAQYLIQWVLWKLFYAEKIKCLPFCAEGTLSARGGSMISSCTFHRYKYHLTGGDSSTLHIRAQANIPKYLCPRFMLGLLDQDGFLSI